MKKLLIILFVLLPVVIYSQQGAMVWYFGNEAGIDFSNGTPVSVNGNRMYAKGGCSSISNLQGALQFYTNGLKIWNKNGEIMEGGDSLNGSQILNQNSIIIPKPLSDSVYYLFTINGTDSLARFTHSVINMNINNGLGKVIKLNDTLLSRTVVVEKIAAVQHCNGEDVWIVVHDKSFKYYALLLTADSIMKRVVSTGREQVKADIGYLKLSPAGDKIVMPLNNENVLAEIGDFDNKTGKISNVRFIYRKNPDTYCFGFEFSPDGNRLYMTTGGKSFNLWQFDLRNQTEDSLNQTAIKISSGNNFAMQLAPDGKIYIARENTSYLNLINRPNLLGEACNYESKGLHLIHGYCHKGLPNFVQSWFYKPSFESSNLCFGDTSLFVFNHPVNVDSLIWEFTPGEGSPVVKGKVFKLKRLFADTMNYKVSVSVFHCGSGDTVTQIIKTKPYPVSSLPADTLLCNQCAITLDAGEAEQYLWSGDIQNRYLEVTSPGWYRVVMSNGDCSINDSVRVYLKETTVYLPNAFTPNGDGLNDVYKPVFQDDLPGYQMWIYNRNGELLFQTQDQNLGWDGTFEGKPVSVSTYVCVVSFQTYNKYGDKITKKQQSFVSVIR